MAPLFKIQNSKPNVLSEDISRASTPFTEAQDTGVSTDIRTASIVPPAAYDGFTGERQVQEAPADLEGQRVLQGVAVYDESHVVLLA